MKKAALLFLFFSYSITAQVGINTTAPSPASALEIKSSPNNISFGGLLPPRVTLAQRNSIPVTASDDGMLVFLINGTQRCLQIYDATESAWQNIYCMPINQPPVASNVLVNGTLTDGQILTGTFTYSDNESNPAGTHTYQWYRANSAAGAGVTAISGATGITYTLTSADIGKYIAFEVVPVANAGASPGLAVRSSYNGPVAAKPTIISFVQLAQSINENAASNNIILRFSFPNVSTSNVSVTVASSAYGRLTQTGPRTIIIPAGQTSPFNITVFNVNNNSLDDNNVTLTFTITNVTGGSGANSVGTPSTDTCTIVDDEVSMTFTESFTAFTGSGFAATPGAGQLDSDIWRVIWSPTFTMPWSSSQASASFAHGVSNGLVANTAANIGVWAFNASGNRCLGLQPGGTSSTGGIYLRIRNTTGVTLTNWDINYVIRFMNDSTTGDFDFGVSYSTNDVTYTAIAGSTPNFGTAPLNAWTAYNYSPNIIATVPNNGYLYLYFEFQNSQAYQYGDELGVDDINVIGSN